MMLALLFLAASVATAGADARSYSLIAAWGTSGFGPGEFREPMGVGVDAQGNVYVADSRNRRVRKLSPEGKFLAEFGGPDIFAPTAAAAVALLLFRHTLSQIDVPTRQAYLMAVVEDHERESAASLTNMSRTLAQSISPALTGWVMGALSLSAPFVLGGTLKVAYDPMLYAAVRRWDSRRA